MTNFINEPMELMTLATCVRNHYFYFQYNDTYYSVIGIVNHGGSRIYECYNFTSKLIERTHKGDITVTPIDASLARGLYEAQ